MKLALVTGGFRRIGAAIAARLASEGWTLALHSHRPAEPDQDFGKWHGFVADLATEADSLIPRVNQHFGRLPDLLVNSASRFEWDAAGTLTAETLAIHHAINAAAPQLLTLAMKSGSVVNILDQRVRNPNRDQLSYTLSKTALAAATRTLAIALAPDVRVNAVAPGLTLPTPDMDQSAMDRVATAMPLERLPTAADIADAVLYFAEARSVTGQTLFVDGGASLKSYDRDFSFF